MDRFTVSSAAKNVAYEWKGNGVYCGDCLEQRAAPASEIRPVAPRFPCRQCGKVLAPLYTDMEGGPR